MNYQSTSQLRKKRYFSKENLIDIAAYLLIIMFFYAGTSKLVVVGHFQHQMMESPLIPRALIPMIAWIIPISEIAIAWLLFFQKTRKIAFYLSFFLMFFFTLYLTVLKIFAENAPCACGGILGSLGYVAHIIFNTFFTLIALYGSVKLSFKQAH